MAHRGVTSLVHFIVSTPFAGCCRDVVRHCLRLHNRSSTAILRVHATDSVVPPVRATALRVSVFLCVCFLCVCFLCVCVFVSLLARVRQCGWVLGWSAVWFVVVWGMLCPSYVPLFPPPLCTVSRALRVFV